MAPETTSKTVRVPGAELYVEEHGQGEPLLLVQGLGYGRWGWDPVVPGLAARYRVIRFDNRGIGDSEKPPGPYTAAEMAEDAVTVLDEHGVERAHVVGASLGGMVAQELALAAPERVDRLVLACTTPGGELSAPMPEQTVRLIQESPALPREVAMRRGVENALAPGADPALIERIMEHRVATAQPLAAWVAQAAAGMTFDVWERVGEIGAPTLVLTGDLDVVVDPRNSELLAAMIPGARLEIFRGTGHLFFWEEPERFVRAVKEFLSE
jgi:pimeloyl-ACP methyl ester carboxylesterase